MSEFDITEWSDFVRGVTDPGAEERMRYRLKSDPKAQRVVAALSRVAALGRANNEDRVPEHAVRIAKSIAVGRLPADAKESSRGFLERGILRRLQCAVAFDSLLQPSPAGTRDIDAPHRQVVFEAESYRIDVRLEHEVEPRSTLAVGQVTSRHEEVMPLARVPVLVFSGEDEVAHAVTSRFGEFQFEGLPRLPLELCLVIGEDFLEIPLVSGVDEGVGA